MGLFDAEVRSLRADVERSNKETADARNLARYATETPGNVADGQDTCWRTSSPATICAPAAS